MMDDRVQDIRKLEDKIVYALEELLTSLESETPLAHEERHITTSLRMRELRKLLAEWKVERSRPAYATYRDTLYATSTSQGATLPRAR